MVVQVLTEHETDSQVTVRLNVIDTGIGIPKDKISSLFNSFQQVDASTSRQFGGTGLGLAISRRLVQLMDGRIGVESTEGTGSNFWFTVVFDKGIVRDRAEKSALADISGVHILAVDNNAVNRVVIAEHMSLWGVRHAEAENALKAMDMLHAAHAAGDPFRIVITDMHMPGMDGEALASAIKADPALKDTLLVMLTSSGMRGDAKRLASLGFAAYLTKPVRMTQLHDCITTVLGGYGLHEKARESIITSHRLREAAKRNLRILLVEDNKVNQAVALGILVKLGFIVDIAANGEQAIKMLQAASYDIVLMDCQMPEMDGYEASRLIRSSQTAVLNHGIPIIAMTANAMKGDRERCLEAGMNDYVSKPIYPLELAKTLDKWLPGKAVSIAEQAIGEPQPAAARPAEDTDIPVFDKASIMTVVSGNEEFARTVVKAFLVRYPRADSNSEGLSGGRQRHTCC